MNTTQIKQKGSTLIVSLVILTVITLGAVVAMQRSTVQTKMIGNLTHKQFVFGEGQNEMTAMLSKLQEKDASDTMFVDALLAHLTNPDLNPIPVGSNGQPLLPTGNAAFGLTTAEQSAAKITVTNELSLDGSGNNGTTSQYSLKEHEGSSVGTPGKVNHFFSSIITVKDSNQVAASKQQVGFVYHAPGMATNN